MRRTITRITLAALILTGVLTSTPTANAQGRGACSGWFSEIRHDMPLAKQQDHTKRTIACAVALWPVPGGLDLALFIADRESHFDPEAYNPSGCAGVYQHMVSLWPGRLHWLHHDWFSPWMWDRGISAFNMRANVLVTIRMASTSGWSAWGF